MLMGKRQLRKEVDNLISKKEALQILYLNPLMTRTAIILWRFDAYGIITHAVMPQ